MIGSNLLAGVVLIAMCVNAEEPPCWRKLHDLATSVPSEFASDVLLKAAADNKALSATVRRNLAEEAFRFAVSAEPAASRVLLPGRAVDTRDGYAGAAGALGLDRLSLQSRAVLLMAQVDAKRARELFEGITLPDLPLASCQSTLIFNIDRYYEAALSIFQTGFDTNEKRKQEHLNFLLSLTTRSNTPHRFSSLARILRSLTLNDDELIQVAGAISATLAEVSGDDRTITAVRPVITSGVSYLMFQCDKAKVPCASSLAKAQRTFLLRSFTHSRCEDNIKRENGVLPRDVEQFDGFLAQLGVADVSPLVADQLVPSKIEQGPKDEGYWTSDSGQRILAKIRSLRFGGTKSQLTTEERLKSEWLGEFDEFMRMLSAWKVTDEKNAIDFVNQKAVALSAATALAPTEDRRLQMLGIELQSLAQTYSDRWRIEWFFHADATLRRTTNLNGADRTRMFAAIKDSPNAILGLYADLYSGCRGALPM